MRVKIWFFLAISSIVVALSACDNTDEDPVINAEEYYGDGSFFISLARISAPEIREDYCGNPTVFELRNKRNLMDFGTVAIFGDGEYLNFQIDILQDRVNEGWGMERSLIWVGIPEDWNEGKDGPDGGWGVVPGIDILSYQSFPSAGLHQIALSDWMFDDCFVVAVRVTVRDPNSNGEAADGFINHGDYLTYSWNEPFCLEKCIDPGTNNIEYWKNNPGSWPFGLTIGGDFYSIQTAIQILNGNNSEDMSFLIFEQLVAAKLNVAIGNTSYCITETIESADAWMAENGPVGSGIDSTHPEWDKGEDYVILLTNYNAGTLCASAAN